MVIKKIRLEKSDDGKTFIHYAWDAHENRIITPESRIRPEVIVEDGMVTNILPNGLDIEFPDFEPFSENELLYFFHSKEEKKTFSTGLAWALANKFLKMLMKDGQLRNDYAKRLEIIENELKDSRDPELKKYIMDRLDMVVSHYQKTNEWDFTLLGN